MARSAGRDRTVCESCDLPFYADRGECPYCGAAGADDGSRVDADTEADEDSGFVFGAGSADRSRTTCPDCGLPHYEDADDCPYCAYAGEAEAPAADDEPTESVEPAGAEQAAGGGLFGRIKRALGF